MTTPLIKYPLNLTTSERKFLTVDQFLALQSNLDFAFFFSSGFSKLIKIQENDRQT